MCFAKKIVLKEKKHTKSIRGKNILLRIVSGFCPHFVNLWVAGASYFERLKNRIVRMLEFRKMGQILWISQVV